MKTLLHAVIGIAIIAVLTDAHNCNCTKVPEVSPCSQFETKVQICLSPLHNFPNGPPDVNQVCPAFEAAKTCMTDLLGSCSQPPASSHDVLSTWQEMETGIALICGKSSGDPCADFDVNAMRCLLPFAEDTSGPGQAPNVTALCAKFRVAESCMAEVLGSCSTPPANSQPLQLWTQTVQYASGACGTGQGGSTASPDGCDGFVSKAQTCMMVWLNFSESVTPGQMPDMDLMCKAFDKTSTCMDALTEACNNTPAAGQQMVSSWAAAAQSTAPLCNSTNTEDISCDQFDIHGANCLKELMPLLTSGGPPDMQLLCRLIGEATPCMDTLLVKCPGSTSPLAQIWGQVHSMCP